MTEHVVGALKERIQGLPAHLVRSLTWDQGNELSSHTRFRVETGVDVYFCDPHSPWHRAIFPEPGQHHVAGVALDQGGDERATPKCGG